MTRQYSSISVETTLLGSINTTATTMTLATGTATALMGGITLAPGDVDIFTVAIDPDTINEEIVFVTNVAGDTLTISRGQAGTGTPGVSGLSHTAGASVKHVLTSSDLIFFRNNTSPVASFGFSGSTSGTTTVQATAVAGTNTLTLPPTSNDTLVGRATTDTLTNKTLTAPKFADGGFIADANGNEMVILDTVTSAVNEVTVANAATAGKPTISATGGDTNITLNLVSKGTGTVQANAVDVVTTTGTQTLTNKTITSPIISTITNTGTLTLPTSTDTLVGRATTDTLTNKTLTDPKINLTIDPETASYTAVLANNGQVVTMNNASANTFSIPTNASVAFPIGTQINVLQIGAGQTTIQAVTSGTTTVLSTAATAAQPKLRLPYSAATCLKAGTDLWYVFGDIA